MKSKTTTSTISVLFREEEHEKMRIFERALRTRCERVAPEVVVLHVQPGFWRQKDGVA
jgi:hypothetical protein